MPAPGDPETREYRNLYEIQDESEGSRRPSVPATNKAGKGVIAIPPTANSTAIAISATDDAASKRLGRVPPTGAGVREWHRWSPDYRTPGRGRPGLSPQLVPTFMPNPSDGQNAGAESQQADAHDDPQ